MEVYALLDRGLRLVASRRNNRLLTEQVANLGSLGLHLLLGCFLFLLALALSLYTCGFGLLTCFQFSSHACLLFLVGFLHTFQFCFL